MTPTPMANEIRTAARALLRLSYACEKGLPEGMEVLPGYPFDVSLDELVADMQGWADRMQDAGL